MMVLLKPYVVLGIIVVVIGLTVIILAKHPLRHPHVPPCVHDNHIVQGICKLKWITFGVTRPFF
jgi:hypothetical protein